MKVQFAMQGVPLKNAGTFARKIEDAGYDGIVTQENANEPFLPLAVASTTTDSIQLATGVAIALPRSPMVVAEASTGAVLSSSWPSKAAITWPVVWMLGELCLKRILGELARPVSSTST